MKRTLKLFCLLFSLVATFSISAPAQIFDGNSLELVDLQEALKVVEPGSIVVIGENHNQLIHQRQQLEVMNILRSYGHSIHTGLEFIYYPDQEKLDQYRSGSISEELFLNLIKWGGDNFNFYKDQILFPNFQKNEHAWALNLPRSITGKIAKSGLESLTSDEALLLPPQFTVGRSNYRKRFMETMPHLDPNKAENYFTSQSAWDDTMAWRAIKVMNQFKDATLVIVSGDFHVAFGGGLPDRLRERGAEKIFTISQFDSQGLSPTEIVDQISPNDGDIRGDLIWVQDLTKPY